jgi:hypothetical protein
VFAFQVPSRYGTWDMGHGQKNTQSLRFLTRLRINQNLVENLFLCNPFNFEVHYLAKLEK